MAQHVEDFQQFLWAQDNCGSCPGPSGIPQGPCALCALWRLHHAGVAAARIVGREAGVLRKVSSVQLVRSVLDRIRKGERKRASQERALSLRGTPDMCASGYMCYYRDCEGPVLARTMEKPEEPAPG
jgi:putative protease